MRLFAVCALGVSGAAIGYTLATDGSPFRMELLTPWMVATLFDFYGLVALISVVLFAVEPSTWVAAAWTVAVCCLGSPAAWTWALWKLIQSKAGDRFWGWLLPADLAATGRAMGKSATAGETEALAKPAGTFED